MAGAPCVSRGTTGAHHSWGITVPCAAPSGGFGTASETIGANRYCFWE
ncbi:hypothetical protein PI125_g5031 [Phytophthora idaei]|nr:hypothetical protein PI125_g5031 [Phytophthora idaei]